jgi:hypothetical protein
MTKRQNPLEKSVISKQQLTEANLGQNNQNKP